MSDVAFKEIDTIKTCDLIKRSISSQQWSMSNKGIGEYDKDDQLFKGSRIKRMTH